MQRAYALVLFCLIIPMHAYEEQQPERLRQRIQIQQLKEEKQQLLRAIGESNTSNACRKIIGLDKLFADLEATNARQASLNALNMRTKITKLEKRNQQLEQALANLEKQAQQFNNALQAVTEVKTSRGKSRKQQLKPLKNPLNESAENQLLTN